MTMSAISGNFNLGSFLKHKREKSFFTKDAVFVAQNILGDFLVLKRKNSFLAGKIVETESYLGLDDDASHAFGGKITARNKIMYSKGGIIYVYLIYGKLWCFNIVVSKKSDPQAVFIRALEPVEGIKTMKKNRGVNDIKKLTNGPCCWTSAFGVDKRYLGKSITLSEIFISHNPHKRIDIVRAKRIGVNYAINSKDLPLRFYIKNNPFISKKDKANLT